ncbi:MAG: trehalose-phosphatase [Bacteroidia bacterium]|nr:trehalose-phosphatase [Bacteroidia bacterium]
MPTASARPVDQLPYALDHLSEISNRRVGKNPALFLDFDGTLSPIVENHEDAELAEGMADLLDRLTSQPFLVSIVSGRGLADVKKRVGREGLYYAGSHGFEIEGPQGLQKQQDEAADSLPEIEQAETELKEKLKKIEGVRFERKKFSVAIHYRKVAENRVAEVEDTIKKVVQDKNKIQMGFGKKIIELTPNLDWHKGRAVNWLLQTLTHSDQKVLPIYIGDDITDENAFRSLQGLGLGFLVGTHGQNTYADYALRDIEEVKQFLEFLIAKLEQDG